MHGEGTPEELAARQHAQPISEELHRQLQVERSHGGTEQCDRAIDCNPNNWATPDAKPAWWRGAGRTHAKFVNAITRHRELREVEDAVRAGSGNVKCSRAVQDQRTKRRGWSK